MIPKNILKTVCVIALLGLCLSGCKGRKQSRRSEAKAKEDSVSFTLMEVPIAISEPQDRLDYSVLHFWDKLSPLCRGKQVEEQFANWLWVSDKVSFDKAVASLLTAYSKDPERIRRLSEKYLFDTQSPYRNESLYGHLCLKIGGELEQTGQECLLNSTGRKAADFTIEDTRGRTFTLYSIDAEYILLVFSNPMCAACKDITSILTTESFILNAISSGRLAVVDVYPDEELDEWREVVESYPKTWKCGFDPTFNLMNSKIYNIRAIPSIYLLDKDKMVILKDAPFERVIGYLNGKL